MTERFVTSEIVKYDWRVAVSPSRGTRVVKGAGMRSQCVVLRRFKSCPLHHFNQYIVLGLIQNSTKKQGLVYIPPSLRQLYAYSR